MFIMPYACGVYDYLNIHMKPKKTNRHGPSFLFRSYRHIYTTQHKLDGLLIYRDNSQNTYYKRLHKYKKIIIKNSDEDKNTEAQ